MGLAHPVVIVLGVLTGLMAIMGIIGFAIYGAEIDKQKFFYEATCNVTGATITDRTCSREHCSTGTTSSSKHCYTDYYTCHDVYWDVVYDTAGTDGKGPAAGDAAARIAGPSSIDSRGQATSIADSHAVGSQSPCYFDTRSYTTVQWLRPDPQTPMIVGAIGFGLGLFGIALIVLIVLIKTKVLKI